MDGAMENLYRKIAAIGRRFRAVWRAPSPKRLWTPRNKIKKMNCGGGAEGSLAVSHFGELGRENHMITLLSRIFIKNHDQAEDQGGFPDWLGSWFYDELTYEERSSDGKWSKPGRGANEAFDLMVSSPVAIVS